jgi:hypothetical protein
MAATGTGCRLLRGGVLDFEAAAVCGILLMLNWQAGCCSCSPVCKVRSLLQRLCNATKPAGSALASS